MKLRKTSTKEGAGSGCMARLVRFLDFSLAVIVSGLVISVIVLIVLVVHRSLTREERHVGNNRLNNRAERTDQSQNKDTGRNLPIIRIELGDGGLKFTDRRGHLEVIDGKGANYSFRANLITLYANGSETLKIPFKVILAGIENGSAVESRIEVVVTGNVLSAIHDSLANVHVRHPTTRKINL